jgi:hypothetical protein
MSNIGRATRDRFNPRPVLPRRIVPHVLPVPALQIGNPIAAFVLMERNNLAQNSSGHSEIRLSPIARLRVKQS